MNVLRPKDHPATEAERARIGHLLRLRDEWQHYLEYRRLKLELQRKEHGDASDPNALPADQPDGV